MSDLPEPSTSRNVELGEEIQSVVLPSGLRVLFCRKPGFKKRYACYSTCYGSVDSRFAVGSPSHGAETVVDVPDGIAHFLEHVLFETPEGNVSDLFAQNGAYNNAATSFTTTTYLFACTERFYDNLELLLRFVENPVFDPEKVEKERGIIAEEIRGYDDSPDWVAYMGLLERLFVAHPFRIDIAGTTESIQEISSALLHRCYESFYRPENMILFVVGDLDPGELFSFVAAHSRAGNRASDRGSISRIYPEEPGEVAGKETRVEMSVALPKLLVGFKEIDMPARGSEFVEVELATSLALDAFFGRSSDLYRRYYERQWILDDFGASYSLGANVGFAMVGGDTPEPDRLRDAILDAAASADVRIDPDDFEREKRRFLGGWIASFNSLETIANLFSYYRLYDFDLFDSVELIAGLDRERVEARLRELLRPDRASVYVVEPSAAS